MGFGYFYCPKFIIAALISLILLELTSSTDAAHYIIKSHQTPVTTSSPGENASRPITAARSHTECVLRCRIKVRERNENLQPFYSNQKECFCLKDDQQEVGDARTKEKDGKGVKGSSFIKVGGTKTTKDLSTIITETNPESSCKSIKRKFGYSALSGLYWIDLSPAAQVYCDMDTDGGGWVQIGRLVTDAQNIDSYKGATSIMSSSYSNLHKAATQNHLLDGDKFADLNSIISFTEYRISCTKPYHGRTNHAKFSNTKAPSSLFFDYITKGISTRLQNMCGVLVYMPDDTSRTRILDCSSVRPTYDNDQRMYDLWFCSGQVSLTIINNSRLECDDHINEPGYNLYGTWMFYVR